MIVHEYSTLLDVQMLLVADWNGWADSALFTKNRFWVRGTARYGPN
jgi:hypothetical protein